MSNLTPHEFQQINKRGSTCIKTRVRKLGRFDPIWIDNHSQSVTQMVLDWECGRKRERDHHNCYI